MIEFVEGEKWISGRWITNRTEYTPIYMVKNGEKHFLHNKANPSTYLLDMQDEERTAQLVKNDGMYVTMHAPLLPFDLLKMFAERKLTFEESCVAKDNIEFFPSMNCWDFAGNSREVSTAFHYRIYDKELAKLISEIVSLIKGKEYNLALNKIKEAPANIAKFTGSDFQQ